jgi:hypothetical protein
MRRIATGLVIGALAATVAQAADMQYMVDANFYKPVTSCFDVTGNLTVLATPKYDQTLYFAYLGWQITQSWLTFGCRHGVVTNWQLGRDIFIFEPMLIGQHGQCTWSVTGGFIATETGDDPWFYGRYRFDLASGSWRFGAHVEQIGEHIRAGPHLSFGTLVRFNFEPYIGDGDEAIRFVITLN